MLCVIISFHRDNFDQKARDKAKNKELLPAALKEIFHLCSYVKILAARMAGTDSDLRRASFITA